MDISNLVPSTVALQRREACEAVLLSKPEKRLLTFIRWIPQKHRGAAKVSSLVVLGLVEPFPDGSDTYRVTDFYFIYKAYLREKRRGIFIQSFLLPFIVSAGVSIISAILSLEAQLLLLPK